MSTVTLNNTPVLVVGAGIMGAGIAQVAAQAGHPVLLFDTREGAAAQAKAQLAKSLDTLAAKGKLTPEVVASTLARIHPANSLQEATAAQPGLVVEAIVENLAAKRALSQQLESLVGADCVLATNTSSISVTAIANGLQRPQRLVGMHFFNPVPVMKLVEVVSGLQTAPEVATAIFDLSQTWGKTPVHARSTPGFIVNRIARPYYAESLALLLEQATTPAVLDGCLRAAGFRMGPCELMDLIGHDTNYAVTNSVFEANFFDKRYQPSLVQREMVDGGLFGRKTGRGFYRYPDGLPSFEAAPTPGPSRTGAGLQTPQGLLLPTDGRTAAQRAREAGTRDLLVFDRALHASGTLAVAAAPGCSAAWQQQALAWLTEQGHTPVLVADTPGLVVARTLAMLVNEAADAVLQGVCTPQGADAAMKLGVNYPAGPFEWLAGWGAAHVVQVLQALDTCYRGERYRVSPWLQRQL
jgi:3-hydroxybutyryl-CoA dehydrogenase